MNPTLLPKDRWRRNTLSALILFHIIVIPLGSYWSEDRNRSNPIKAMLSNYVYGMRVRQYWALFSPEPRRHAVRYAAYILYKSGKMVIWRRPYATNWNFFQRHLAYNFQKWDLVTNNLDFKSGLWDSLVHYLSKQYEDSANPIAEIQFIRSNAPWPQPNPTGYVGGEISELRWNDRILFTYDAVNRRYL